MTKARASCRWPFVGQWSCRPAMGCPWLLRTLFCPPSLADRYRSCSVNWAARRSGHCFSRIKVLFGVNGSGHFSISGIRCIGWPLLNCKVWVQLGSGRGGRYTVNRVTPGNRYRSLRCFVFSPMDGFNIEPCRQTALWSLAESNFPSICFD